MMELFDPRHDHVVWRAIEHPIWFDQVRPRVAKPVWRPTMIYLVESPAIDYQDMAHMNDWVDP